LVDETNGNEYSNRVKRFRVKSKKICPACGTILEITYHIPKRKGHRIEDKTLKKMEDDLVIKKKDLPKGKTVSKILNEMRYGK